MSAPVSTLRSNDELLDVVYDYAERVSVCGETWCPTIEDGGYCVECHVVAYNARMEVLRRLFVGLRSWLGAPS